MVKKEHRRGAIALAALGAAGALTWFGPAQQSEVALPANTKLYELPPDAHRSDVTELVMKDIANGQTPSQDAQAQQAMRQETQRQADEQRYLLARQAEAQREAARRVLESEERARVLEATNYRLLEERMHGPLARADAPKPPGVRRIWPIVAEGEAQ